MSAQLNEDSRLPPVAGSVHMFHVFVVLGFLCRERGCQCTDSERLSADCGKKRRCRLSVCVASVRFNGGQRLQ